MFIPSTFAENDPSKLHHFMEQNSFGILVSQVDGAPFATHIPFLLRREEGRYGTLIGHVARANPQWRQISGQTALVIFPGPHAYISPTWYETPGTVPTWNYVTVHAYGAVQLIEDSGSLHDILTKTVSVYESGMPSPWSYDVADPNIDMMLKAIVGFRIEISRLEGKAKLNQNHPEERRRKVIRALEVRSDADSQAIAKRMTATLSG